MQRSADPRDTHGNLPPMRVLIADDHAGFREGLKEMLLTDEGIEVVGEARDGKEAAELVGRVRPDVVVLDLAMPVMDGRDTLGLILRDVSPPPGVVILTMHDGTARRRELSKLGASAFLAKSASLAEIISAVKGANPK
jgi:DNA-binding NarL/FixJ family response regulator